MNDKPIYIIANPVHSLGFLVMTDLEPIGFYDPVKALRVLENVRLEKGVHINLYKVESVREPIVDRKELEKYLLENGNEGFEFSMVSEYLK